MPHETRRGPGRPPRREGQPVLITIRATSEERETYSRAAEAAGLSVSEWIRSLVEAELKRKAKK